MQDYDTGFYEKRSYSFLFGRRLVRKGRSHALRRTHLLPAEDDTTALRWLTRAARPATTALPVPVRAGDPSLIKHVVYIIKENRTYDQLFGDLDRQRDALSETVARLRDFEQRYRSSLHDHLHGQLSTLEKVGLEPEGGPERTAPQEQPAASAAVAPDAPDAGPDQAPAPAEQGSAGTGPTTPSPSGTSDTPRLDALLGEQR